MHRFNRSGGIFSNKFRIDATVMIAVRLLEKPAMLKKERHQFIIETIKRQKKVLSSHLADQLRVSDDTVIRDLNELARRGQLLKVYGGALSKSFQFSADLQNINTAETKRTVAKKAASLITHGMSVLMGGGSTIVEIVRQIPENIRATVFTICPLTALELAGRPGMQVILIGGQLCKYAGVTTGSQVTNYLSEIKTDLCFLEGNCISAETGLTESDVELAYVKKSMIKAASKLIIVAASANINSEQRLKVCDTNQIHTLITELDPSSEALAPYSETGIHVL